MADKEEGEENTLAMSEWERPTAVDNEGEEAPPRGIDWEVVSLTASAYAAAPGPRGDESIHEEKGGSFIGDDEGETSRDLFMSGHFVFPPNQHENLPLEPEKLDSQKEAKEVDLDTEMDVLTEGKSEQEENWRVDGLSMTEDFPGIPLFDEKSNRMMSTHGHGSDEPTALHRLNFDGKEQNNYGTAQFSSFDGEDVIGGSTVYDGSSVSELVEASDHGVDPSYAVSQPPESGKEDEDDDSELPCGAWWKKRVASLCAQAKDTSAFWSIFVAAAVMGLVVLGQRWQQERWQVLQQRWQLSISDEKSGKILSRLKDVLVGGSRRGTYIVAAVER